MMQRLFIAAFLLLCCLHPVWATATDMHFRMDLPQVAPDDQPYLYGYDYASPEGFTVPLGNWWIGDQSYLPYYGFNPPTYPGYTDEAGMPYYPPYGNGAVPSPLLAQPNIVVPPLLATPLAPPPIDLTMLPGGGVGISRDPHFYQFSVPSYPDFLTNGSAIYPSPRYYYPPYPYPYYYPYPRGRR